MFLLPVLTHDGEVIVGNAPVFSVEEQIKIAMKSSRVAAASKYEDTTVVSATSNDVERLFSYCKLIYTDLRKCMSPYHFECLLYLHYNRDLWDVRSVVRARAALGAMPEEQEDDSDDEF